MKRWLVNMRAGVVQLADLQEPSVIGDEYVVKHLREIAFVRAADELGAWVRAKQMMEQERTMTVWRTCIDEGGTMLTLHEMAVSYNDNPDVYFGDHINRSTRRDMTPDETFTVIYVNAVDELGAFAAAMDVVAHLKEKNLWVKQDKRLSRFRRRP